MLRRNHYCREFSITHAIALGLYVLYISTCLVIFHWSATEDDDIGTDSFVSCLQRRNKLRKSTSCQNIFLFCQHVLTTQQLIGLLSSSTRLDQLVLVNWAGTDIWQGLHFLVLACPSSSACLCVFVRPFPGPHAMLWHRKALRCEMGTREVAWDDRRVNRPRHAGHTHCVSL